jgi:pimeloyl-ACP methyl ester carboxylesterase
VASEDYPIGIPPQIAEALLDQVDQLWGTDAMAAMWVPSRAGDERFRRWLAKMQRATASPRAAQASLRAVLEVDVRPVLPLIQAPTLVLHRKDFHAVPIEQSRYLAVRLGEVGAAGDGRMPFKGAVGPVVVIPVQPGPEAGPAGLLAGYSRR